MLRLLERNIASIEQRLVLLAPRAEVIPQPFRNQRVNPHEHRALVREMQGLRGSIYLEDGAIRRHQLTTEGLHCTPEDERSWHLLMLNRQQRVSSCVWYMEHQQPQSIEELRVRHCPLRNNQDSREILHAAVEHELDRARKSNLRYVEVGGWAVSKDSRCSSEGLLLALAAYSMGRLFGGSLGLTTATVRHSSAMILRRLGGSYLETHGQRVAPYFDPKYRCEMELLRFDSRRPNPKYVDMIERLRERLANVAVIADGNCAFKDGSEPLFAA
jgi:hypothetical protein